MAWGLQNIWHGRRDPKGRTAGNKSQENKKCAV